jgi:hypothetical protein
MIDENVYSVQTLSTLFKLNEFDIEKILLKEGKICFSMKNTSFVVFIPTLNMFTTFDSKRHYELYNNLSSAPFSVTREHSLLKVSLADSFSSSFLLTDSFVPKIEEHMDVTEDTYFLLSDRLDVPLFIGNKNVISRLADDFDGDTSVLSIKDFNEWRAQNV